MILQALLEYYEALAKRGEIALPGWSNENVSFALNISLEGELIGVIPVMQTVTRGKKEVLVPQQMEVPVRVVRSSGIKANFLCDNTAYILGFDNKGKRERAMDCFVACRQLHFTLLEKMSGPGASAIKKFFTNWNPQTAHVHPILEPYLNEMDTANIVFYINGECYAHSDVEIRKAWQEYYNTQGDGVRLRCLVSGTIAPMAALHGKIKNVPGAQSAGATLISFNAPAYESYGKGDDNQPNAPISEYAAFAYVTALNYLLANRKHKIQIGDTTVVYWAESADPEPQQTFSIFASPEPDTESLLAGMMENISTGKPIDNVDMTKKFYILGLSPNAARLSVRFFLQDSFGNIIKNIHQHYERLEIKRPAFDQRQYLSLYSVLNELNRTKSKTKNKDTSENEKEPAQKKKSNSPLPAAFFRSVLTGTNYPEALYQGILTRVHAERNVTRGRAAIIKAYLTHNKNENEVTSMALNETSKDRAYVLGRLFAVLEDAQITSNNIKSLTNSNKKVSEATQDAEKEEKQSTNSILKNRYFSAACATPGIIFPQMLKLSNYHTAKFKRSKDGQAYYVKYEKLKGILLDKLDLETNPIPKQLSLQDQGIFILGYYHQVQARYTKKEENNNDTN